MPGYGEAVLEQRRKFRDEWLPQHKQSIVGLRDEFNKIPAYDAKRTAAIVKRFNSEPRGWLEKAYKGTVRFFSENRSEKQDRDNALQNIYRALNIDDTTRQNLDNAIAERSRTSGLLSSSVLDSYLEDAVQKIEGREDVKLRMGEYREAKKVYDEALASKSQYKLDLIDQHNKLYPNVFATEKRLDILQTKNLEELYGLKRESTNYKRWRDSSLTTNSAGKKRLVSFETFLIKQEKSSGVTQSTARRDAEAKLDSVWSTARRIVDRNIMSNNSFRSSLLGTSGEAMQRNYNLFVEAVATDLYDNHTRITNSAGEELTSETMSTLGSKLNVQDPQALKIRPYFVIDTKDYVIPQQIVDNIMSGETPEPFSPPLTDENDNGDGVLDSASAPNPRQHPTFNSPSIVDPYDAALEDAYSIFESTGNSEEALEYYNTTTAMINKDFEEHINKDRPDDLDPFVVITPLTMGKGGNTNIALSAAHLDRLNFIRSGELKPSDADFATRSAMSAMNPGALIYGQGRFQDKRQEETLRNLNASLNPSTITQEIKETGARATSKEQMERSFTAPKVVRQGFGNITNIFDPEVWARARAGSYENYIANKENPKEQEDNSMLGAFIDFFIPKADASLTKTIEVEAKPTQIGRYVEREEQRQADAFKDKRTIVVDDAYVDGREIVVDTVDPVGYLRNKVRTEGWTPIDSFVVYASAIQKHNDEFGSANASYQLKPVEQSMVWAYQADPKRIPELENLITKREQRKKEGLRFKRKADSPKILKEIETYANRVSDMTTEQKEKEFERQLRVARSVGVITENDLIRNSVEFRKLQSIFGEDDNRNIGRLEPTTVNDKVYNYYGYLDTYVDRSYDKLSTIYRNALSRVKSSPQPPPSLLAAAG